MTLGALKVIDKWMSRKRGTAAAGKEVPSSRGTTTSSIQVNLVDPKTKTTCLFFKVLYNAPGLLH